MKKAGKSVSEKVRNDTIRNFGFKHDIVDDELKRWYVQGVTRGEHISHIWKTIGFEN